MQELTEMRILVVDDEKLILTLLARMLQKQGFTQVKTANSAQEALALLDHFEIDLMITDLMMPEISGLELCRIIRNTEKWDKIPIIMLTGSAEQSNLSQAFEEGVTDYITKPVQPVELMARLKSCLRLKVEVDKRIKKEQELRDSSRKMQNDLDAGRKAQLSLLPMPTYDQNVTIKGHYLAADTLGGDMYYWQKIDQHRYGVILMDVMGHGISTAFVAIFIRALLPGIFLKVAEPKAVITELNQHMNKYNKAANQDLDSYFTAIYLLVDTRQKKIDYVNAGHPMGLVNLGQGRLEYLHEGCMPVGMMEELDVKTGSVAYCHQAQVFIYSDGMEPVLIGSDKQKLGNKFRELLAIVDQGKNTLTEELLAELHCHQREDDISFVELNLTE